MNKNKFTNIIAFILGVVATVLVVTLVNYHSTSKEVASVKGVKPTPTPAQDITIRYTQDKPGYVQVNCNITHNTPTPTPTIASVQKNHGLR